MFCVVRLQVILVKSSICPSNNTFSVVDIVSEGIQESEEAGYPSRHLAVQRLPLPIFPSPLPTLCLSSSHTHIHAYTVDNHLKTATVMNASFGNTNKDCASTFQALQFPPWFIHRRLNIHSHVLYKMHVCPRFSPR